jgi:hypothetical protein
VTAADNGAQFRVIVSNNQGSVASQDAALIVGSGTDAQQAQALKLMSLWTDGLAAAGAPLQFVDDAFKAKAINEVCLGGNATLTLDGSAAPAAGQSFPVGQHTLAAQFSACTGDFGIGYDGGSSLVYNFAGTDHRVGTGQATLTNFINSDVNEIGDPVSTRVQGAARVELDGSLNGSTETSRLRFIPGTGLSLTDTATGAVAAFTSGNVLTHSVNLVTATGTQPQISRQEYTQLSFTRGGVTYVTDGFVQFDFDAQGHLSSGSGVVTITADGQLMARVRATAAGFAVEIVSPPPGVLAAPTLRRASVGAAKPLSRGLRSPRL